MKPTRISIRNEVRRQLKQSPSFNRLRVADQRALVNTLTTGVYSGFSDKRHPPRKSRTSKKKFPSRTPRKGSKVLLKNVDFPKFVARLIQGVFDANVDTTIQQMKAYADLLRQVAKTIDHFAKRSGWDDDDD